MQVPDALMPSLSSGLATVTPGISRSTKNVVMPRYPYLIKKALCNVTPYIPLLYKNLLTAEEFALAKTKKTPAISEFEIHIFVPFIT